MRILRHIAIRDKTAYQQLALWYWHCAKSTALLALCYAFGTVLLAQFFWNCTISTVLLELCTVHCPYTISYITVLFYQHSSFSTVLNSTVLITLCYQHSTFSTVLNSTAHIAQCFQDIAFTKSFSTVVIARCFQPICAYTAKINSTAKEKNSTDASAASARFSISE